MRNVLAFRDFGAAKGLTREIIGICEDLRSGPSEIKIMEVCGGHTISIFKHGIRKLLPEKIRLVSGPGCPVCVTPMGYIDYAVELSKQRGVAVATFGDLMRVPGSTSSLLKEKAAGADVRVCYSPLDALEFARKERNRKIIFLGIGFETTAPAIAAVVKRAREERLSNFLVHVALKTMPNAMRALVTAGELGLHAFICPGHVTAITGQEIYGFLARDYRTPCVVSGFEPLDLLQSIYMIVRQIKSGRAEVENQYKRTTRVDGNQVARRLLSEVFSPVDSNWRGIGVISESGLAIRDEFAAHDAMRAIPLELAPARENRACICGDIMRGVKTPHNCPLFGKVCTPEDPKGACMVSDEGTCATYFKYFQTAEGR